MEASVNGSSTVGYLSFSILLGFCRISLPYFSRHQFTVIFSAHSFIIFETCGTFMNYSKRKVSNCCGFKLAYKNTLIICKIATLNNLFSKGTNFSMKKLFLNS